MDSNDYGLYNPENLFHMTINSIGFMIAHAVIDITG